MVSHFITFMIEVFITFMVEICHIYGQYYIILWLLSRSWVIHGLPCWMMKSLLDLSSEGLILTCIELLKVNRCRRAKRFSRNIPICRQSSPRCHAARPNLCLKTLLCFKICVMCSFQHHKCSVSSLWASNNFQKEAFVSGDMRCCE